MDEVRKGNYMFFVNHILNQIPDAFKMGSLDVKLLSD